MLRALWSAVSRRRATVWTLADQVWVSGCNFAIGVLLARLLGVQEFGQWVLLWGVALYANTLAQACVNGPMMSIVPRLASAPERTELLLGALGLQLALSVTIGVVIILVGYAMEEVWPHLGAGRALWPLALGVVALQAQDWLRRYYFVMNQSAHVLAVDVLAYGGQLTSMLALQATTALDVVTAWFSLIVPFGLAFAVGCFRSRLQPRLHQARVALSALGRAGRDYLLASQLHWIGSQGVLFVGAASLGAGAAGGVRSAQTIVGVANIGFQALENMVPVRCAALWRDRGPAAVRRYLLRILYVVGGPLFAFLVVVSLFSTPLVRLIYGAEFEPFAALVIWQCAYMAIQFLARLLSYWCRTTDRTLRIAASTLATATVSVAATALLAPRWHEHGLMLALVLGAIAALTVLAWPQRRTGSTA